MFKVQNNNSNNNNKTIKNKCHNNQKKKQEKSTKNFNFGKLFLESEEEIKKFSNKQKWKSETCPARIAKESSFIMLKWKDTDNNSKLYEEIKIIGKVNIWKILKAIYIVTYNFCFVTPHFFYINLHVILVKMI